MNIWSDDIVDLVLNIISLIQLENSFAIDLEKAIKNKAPPTFLTSRIDEKIAKYKKHGGVTNKPRTERHEFWG